MTRRIPVLATALAVALSALASAQAGTARKPDDVRVLAHVPPPGYPALSLVTPDRMIWVGTFMDARGQNTAPSKVFGYSPSGRLLKTFTVKGQTPGVAHGVQVAEYDAHGRLYLLDQHPARVLVLDPGTGRQSTYATFRDIPTCSSANRPADCSDSTTDNEPEPDYASWLPDGSLLVTDYQQSVVWRVPRGGGEAQVWLSDPRLDGTQFGPAGIVTLPGGHTVLLSTSAGGVTSAGNPTAGKLYRLTVDGGRVTRMTQLWESGPAEAPDGFAVGRSGRIYLALVGPIANTVVVLSPDGGSVLARIPSNPIANEEQQVPFDEPSSVQFLDDRLIVTNDAYFSGNPSHFVLFDVFAGERGMAHFLPSRK